MRYHGLGYRGHNPRWAFAPTSGDGAAIHGGRFNPKGVPALYLSTSPQGAFLEATQGFAYKFNPLTMCTYEIDCTDIIDLTTDAARMEAGVSMADMVCPWFLNLSDNKRPISWTIYESLHKTAVGIHVQSFAVGATAEMTNLVLWQWENVLPHKVQVFDPEQRLPKDQQSWKL